MKLRLAATVLVAAALAHLAQREADRARFADDARRDTIFLPSAGALRVAVLGYDTAAADVLWVRTVLRFVDVFEGREPAGTRWLRTMLDAVATLDPRWRTVYFYGGTMLRVVGDIDGSDEMYRRGMEALPDDPFFPFSLGMNAYLYRNDAEAAYRYIDRAARLPAAPRWYRAAAAAFLDRHGERRAAIRYLREELEAETRPEVREVLEQKLRRLVHDEVAEELDRRRRAWEEEHGRPLDRLDALGPLPPDPYGEGWILAPDGAIRSAARDRAVAERERRRERALLLRKKKP